MHSVKLLSTIAIAIFPVISYAESELQSNVDRSFSEVKEAVEQAHLTEIVQIDHARLAFEEGVEMPPSRVLLFSDPKVNSLIMQDNIRAGLDLPFRILSYGDRGLPAVSYTSSAFLEQRHGISNSTALTLFDTQLKVILDELEGIAPRPVPASNVEKDFGIIEIKSAYDVPETVKRLKKAVTAQTDTIWFGNVDFAKEAVATGEVLVPAQLLLFGGPKPGGVAMAEYPAIGLDAFCQKLLVYQAADGKAVVLFNDIAAFAEHYYGQSAEPHAMLNKRLTATFTTAVE